MNQILKIIYHRPNNLNTCVMIGVEMTQIFYAILYSILGFIWNDKILSREIFPKNKMGKI